ncbi:hypothetical protein D0Z07_1023 [Hyphodiscus hymeniophilus]|uniref:KOW domain-containing protein n=1 Tax=Hyphodiscus hymeniophilus TaxID=353542 RepID=A0A9P6VRT3_9HELO|nr:hypothetical protein D0Z07_1023 [Hyphodiscus hymeniophilus]
MQKVIRRTILAEKQAIRRNASRSEKRKRDALKNTLEQQGFHRGQEIKDIKAARVARREDWELGPLAPKRDAGANKLTYGTIHTMRTKGPVLSERQQKERSKYVGEKYKTVVVGDRVVITEGRDTGKIGQVVEMDHERGECKVDGLNMMDVRIPDYMLASEQEQDKRPIRSMEQPVPYSWIRLVIQLRNSETGLLEDVICEKVETTKPYYEKRPNGTKAVCSRFITMPDSSRIYIDYPGRSEKARKERKAEEEEKYKDTPSDTLRMEVEQKSFVPTLLRPPMPSSVIDELRNKYSIFRTRHDAEYIEKKLKEDEEKNEKKKLVAKMRTPIKEINRLEKKMKKAKGKGKLTEEMLERIGKVIAEKRNLQLDLAAKIAGEPAVVTA